MSGKRVLVKVCGITSVEQSQALQKMGVDFLGFIFHPASPRFALERISLDEIASISHPKKIGVFTSHSTAQIVEIAKSVGLWGVQLHGAYSARCIGEIKQQLPLCTILKVLSIENSLTENQRKSLQDPEAPWDMLLLDTATPTLGGSGQSFNWKLLEGICLAKPFFLAGGVSLENSSLAQLLTPRPYALDVNSRFETAPGVKDLDKIYSLLEKLTHGENL